MTVSGSGAPGRRATPVHLGWLLIAAALVTIGLKTAAWLITGSVGLLSDALESIVNLATALLAVSMLSIAARPPDESHAYGHSKAEYFSSAVEGALIVLAAAGVVWVAVPRLFEPQPLAAIDVGLLCAIVAGAINRVVAQVLLRAGREQRSAALEASARHLIADYWTTIAVFISIGVVRLTGWYLIDPLIALFVAVMIVRTGYLLLRDSTRGLMDTVLAQPDRDAIETVLEKFRQRGVQYHALRTRQAGSRKFASVHILVPGEWSVQRGHEMLEEIEADVHAAVPGVHIFTHLEPIEDPAAFRDIGLDRP